MHHQQGALVVLMESLHQVDHAQGFPHALVGFQSFGAQDCRLTHLKGWDETLNDSVRARFGDLRSEGATRLGAFVRHGAWMLTEKTHGPRLLLLLSDGMPRDLRGHESDYQGRLAEQDTAIAVRQARATGVHVTCVSLAPQQDQTANLGRVFGENNCLQIDRLEALPHRLGALFAQLVGT